MNTEQLKKQIGSEFRLRPIVDEVDVLTGQRRPADDLWVLGKVEQGAVELVNARTGQTVKLGNDNVREFRSPHFLLLRCGLTVIGDRVHIEPLLSLGAMGREPRPLTSEEHDVLIRARDRGEIHMFSSAQTGQFVTIGPVHYLDPKDPSVAVRYRDALDSLIERGLVRHEAGVLYQLTGDGFKIARALRPRLRVELPDPVKPPGHMGPPYTPTWNVNIRLTAADQAVSVVEIQVEEENVGKWLLDELHGSTRVTLPLQVVGAAQFGVRVRSPRSFDPGPVKLGNLTLRVRDHLHAPEDAHDVVNGPATTQ
jgi:hypothetical protein